MPCLLKHLPLSLALVAGLPGLAQAATPCDQVPAWVAAQAYRVGDRVSYHGRIYEAQVPGGNIPPDYCPPCGWWKYLSDCGSDPVCTTAPARPEGLTSPGQTSASVDLNWQAVPAGSGCTVTYQVYQDGVQVASPVQPAVTIGNLKPETTYTFTVAAVNQAGTSAPSPALAVKTRPQTVCTQPPSVPAGLASPGQSSTSVQLVWGPVSGAEGCSVVYHVMQDGVQVATVPTPSAVVDHLKPSTTYTFTVAAANQAGTSAPSQPLSVQTPSPSDVKTTGTIQFHLHLGVSGAQDRLVLDGDNYTDLIMSNLVAGVLYGHLIKTYYPGIQFDRDYLYGSILGQLLQENLATDLYKASDDRICPDPSQQAVMGIGQGGPYQINNYAVDMVNGTYSANGYALINFVTVQKNIGYTMADSATQNTKPTPPSFNNKYYSPVLTAYFHYMDFVALNIIGKGEGGWQTPWQPAYDQSLETCKGLPNNFLDVLLNVAYNQGFYGPLMKQYSALGATATPVTVATVRAYSSVWGKANTYEQYPYQVKYYLDQMYGNPIPTTSPTDTIVPGTHIAFPMITLGRVFSKVYQTLAHVDASGQYSFITAAQADAAFRDALGQAGLPLGTTLDLSKASDRDRIFTVLEKATALLETRLGTAFNARTLKQL